MTINRMLILAGVNCVVLIAGLAGPYIGVEIALLVVSIVVSCSGLAILFAFNFESAASASLRNFERGFYIFTAGSVLPVAVFFYLGAPGYIQVLAAAAVVLCSIFGIRTIDIRVKRSNQ